MKHSLLNEGGRRVFSWRSGLLFFSALCFLTLSGFQCDQDDEIHVPDGADVGATSYNAGIAFGSPGTNLHYEGTDDPCVRFVGGMYKIKKVVIIIFRYDNQGNEVPIYDPVVLKDGVNFNSGNPNSPKGPGMKYQVPEHGAYRIRVRVYGYPCDELPNPGTVWPVVAGMIRRGRSGKRFPSGKTRTTICRLPTLPIRCSSTVFDGIELSIDKGDQQAKRLGEIRASSFFVFFAITPDRRVRTVGETGVPAFSISFFCRRSPR